MFDSTPDPGAAAASFPGTTTVGSTLAGLPAILSQVVVEIGRKPKPATPSITPPKGTAGGPLTLEGQTFGTSAGDQPDLVSLDKAALHIYQTDPPNLSSLQKQMWDGGWFSNTTYKDGYSAGMSQSGDDTEAAWNNVVLTSAKTGKSIQEVLQDAIDRTNKAGGISSVRKIGAAAASAPPRPTAKVDLYHYGNAIARTLIGREMPRDQMDKFIAQYQSQEQAGEAGSPEASAEAFLQSNDGAQVGAQRMVTAFDSLMQMVGGTKPVTLGG